LIRIFLIYQIVYTNQIFVQNRTKSTQTAEKIATMSKPARTAYQV